MIDNVLAEKWETLTVDTPLYEYTTIYCPIDGGADAYLKGLNEKAKEGWRVIHITKYSTMLLERQKVNG